MRPAGEIRLALMQACVELLTPERAPTVREIAARACVGYLSAMRTIDNMRRAGHLCVVRKRRVAHCNRKLAEFAPADAALHAEQHDAAPLVAALRAWG